MNKVIISVILLFLSVIMAHSISAAPIELKFGTMDPAQATPVVKAYNPWLERINDASEGTIKIRLYPGGILGRDPKIQLKLVTDGIVDLALIVPSYTPGRFPDDEVFDLPFIAENGMEAAIASNRLYKKGLLSGYSDVHVIAHYTTEMYYLHSTYPVRYPKDLAGHKLRAINNAQSEIYKLVNAIGIGLTSSEMAESLSRGILDGVICDNSAMFTFRVADVTPYHLQVPFGNTAVAIVMNKEKYQSLPPEAKEAIDKHGDDIVEMFVRAIQDEIERGMNKLKADPKYQITTPTAAEMKIWEETLQPVTDNWVGEDTHRKELLDAYFEEIKRIRSGN